MKNLKEILLSKEYVGCWNHVIKTSTPKKMNNFSYCLARYYQIINHLDVQKRVKGEKRRALFKAAREKFCTIDNEDEGMLEKAYQRDKSTIRRYRTNGNVLLEAFPEKYPIWLDRFPTTKAQLLAKAKLANNLLYQSWIKETEKEEDTTNYYQLWFQKCKKESTGK